jgi:vacuolar protein-sorting-associated protein 4
LQVIMVAAALRPWYMPGKLARRFDRRFYTHLPNASERAAIFKQQLDKDSGGLHDLKEVNLTHIGQETRDFTGADVCVLVRTCVMEPIRHIQKATHFRFVLVPGNYFLFQSFVIMI